jgi:hypothetical protein
MSKIRRGCFWEWLFGAYFISLRWGDYCIQNTDPFFQSCRMGTDLNLHRKTAMTSQDTKEGKARDVEVHNRERMWIARFVLDRSFSAQMRKPNSIKEE